jgi:hypothetical protein
MALGDITETVAGETYVVELLASAIAANGIPTTTAGIDIGLLRRRGRVVPDRVRVGVKHTAGTGTMTVTLRVWGRAGSIWFRLKDLNVSSAAPHTAVAIPETSADAIQYSEVVEGISGCDRLYLEILVIAGTNTAVAGYLIVGA